MIKDYIKDVDSGSRNAGWREKLAVQRFKDLRKKYDYDEQEVERILNIVHLFKYAKGDWRGKPFNLLPHQAFFLGAIFGLKLPNGTRLIREAMLNMAKKEVSLKWMECLQLSLISLMESLVQRIT